METKEIVAVLEELARSSEDAAVSDPRNEEHFSHTARALREAIIRVEISPLAQENVPDPGKRLTWDELQARVGRTVFAEFSGKRVPSGECTVACVRPNGVCFTRNGQMVRVVLAREYGRVCLAYDPAPTEGTL